MDFLVFYPKGKNIFIEIVPDKLIDWQPKTEDEIENKVKELFPLISQLKDYSLQNKVDQIMIIDCDKAIQFDRLNYVLICKLISKLHEKHPDDENVLKRIEVRHCNSAITGIYNASKSLLPKKITDIFYLYNN